MKTKFKVITLFSFLLMLSCFSKISAQKLNYEDLYSSSTVAIDADSSAILFNKNGDKKVYPASTTKIVTAIIAIENMDLDTPITASSNAIYSTPFGSSIIYLKVGEVMSLKNLLYGLLVKSGNDAANVIGEAVSGDIDTFVELMNEKVKEIGCTNTHFTNTHGFHDDDHYTTASDMAKIMKYCLQNDTFKQIIQTQKYTIEKTNKTEQQRILINTNKMFNKNYKDMYYEYIIGGKTGYTDEAQGTFVGYLKKDDKNIIVATFDAPQYVGSNEARFLDTIKVSDYIFDDFNKNTIIAKDKFSFDVIDKKNKKKYTIGLKNDIDTLSDNTVFRINYDIDNMLGKEFSLNDVAGTLNIKVKNSDNDFYLENSYDLIVLGEEDYKYFNLYEHLGKIIFLLIIILLILIAINKNYRKKSRKNSKKHKLYR